MADSRLFGAPGGGLAHPIAIAAMLTLIANDHWWKHAHPSWLTGKLSDFAGIVFFPLLLEAVVEVVAAGIKRYDGPSSLILYVMIGLTAVGFTWVKTTALGAHAYGLVLGGAQWPFQRLIAWVLGRPPHALGHPGIVRDASDLGALVGLALTYVVGRARRLDHLDR